MKDLLIVIQFVRRGGVENVAINYGLHLDRKLYNVSFMCVGVDETQDEAYKASILSGGYRVYEIPADINSRTDKYRYLNRFFAEHHFDIVHSHTIFFSALVLKAAKNNGIPVRVAHSHVMMWNHDETLPYKLYKNSMKLLLNRVANRKLACTQKAGEFLYGKREYAKHGIFVPNGIDTTKFAFNAAARRDIRREFGIAEDVPVVGHIGTVYEIKNQTFLTEIFAHLLKTHPDARLLLVGERADDEPVLKKIEALKLSDSVMLTGSRADVDRFYSAFDIMIFPSLHEALPVSLIEAQASGLPCLISDAVTTEVKFNENVDFLSLQEPPAVWAEKAETLLKIDRSTIHTEALVNEYDIHNVVQKLNTIYR